MKYFSATAFFFSVLLLASCFKSKVRPDGFSEAGDVFYYKLCKIGDGQKKPEKGEVLLLNAKFKTQRDSVFFDSRHNAWMGYFRPFTGAEDKASFSSYFAEMNEGDSLNFMMRAQDFFKEFFESEVPYFSAGDSIIKAEIKLVAIMDSSDMEPFMQSRMLELKENSLKEQEEILNYAKTQWKEYEGSPESVLVKKVRQTNDSIVAVGKNVSILYTGYFLDGTVFDNSQSAKTFDFTYGSQHQLLNGINLILRGMRKGEIAKIILPSHLAYGAEGSGSIVPPYTPVVYEIEVVDVTN